MSGTAGGASVVVVVTGGRVVVVVVGASVVVVVVPFGTVVVVVGATVVVVVGGSVVVVVTVTVVSSFGGSFTVPGGVVDVFDVPVVGSATVIVCEPFGWVTMVCWRAGAVVVVVPGSTDWTAVVVVVDSTVATCAGEASALW